MQRYVFTYDSKGHRTETDIFDSTKTKKPGSRFIETTDAQGRAIEGKSFDADGNRDGHYTYQFNSVGDLVREVSYTDAGQIDSVTTWRYDSRHRILLEETRDSSGAMTFQKTASYDEAGNKTEETSGPRTEWARYVSQYDERGRVRSIETITGRPIAPELNSYGQCGDCGAFPGKTTFRYNENG